MLTDNLTITTSNVLYYIKPLYDRFWWIPQRIIPVRVVSAYGGKITARLMYSNGCYSDLIFDSSDIGQVLFESRKKAQAELAKTNEE